jgi:hypothetical protein
MILKLSALLIICSGLLLFVSLWPTAANTSAPSLVSFNPHRWTSPDIDSQNPASTGAQTFNQEQALAELRKRIAGQESKPAEEVFKNIQLLKGVPAGRLLKIMEIGYGKSLGVDCTHCHLVGQWEKDEKPTKQIAREMALMVKNINTEYLKNIKNLKSATPVINCTTCHRGQIKPALNMP